LASSTREGAATGADLDRPDQIQWRKSPTREEAAAGAWTGAVDLVHGFTVHRLHKGEELRDLGHRFHDLRLRCSTSGGMAASGGARRCFTGVSPATIQNGLSGRVLSMEGLYVERGTRRTYLDGRRGGSGGHGALTVNSCIKVRLDLQADKSPVVVKGPFFPRVVNPRYRIRGTMCIARNQSSKAR
jgi:hypothetical protein